MKKDPKLIRFDAPNADNNLTTNPPEIEMFDDAGAEQEFSNSHGSNPRHSKRGRRGLLLESPEYEFETDVELQDGNGVEGQEFSNTHGGHGRGPVVRGGRRGPVVVDGGLWGWPVYDVEPDIELADGTKPKLKYIAAEGETEFSNAYGRRNECKSRGLKPFTKEFRDCVKELRKEDKGKSHTELTGLMLKRRKDHQQATAEGREKQGWLGKVFHVIKAGVLSGQRIPYLLLLRFNLWNMATKIANLETLKNRGDQAAKDKFDKILTHWVHWGGDITEFKHNMNIGKVKKPLLVRPPHRTKLLSFDGEEFSYSDGGIGEGIVASAPVWVPIVGMLVEKSVKGKDNSAPLMMNPDDQKAALAAAAKITPLTPEQLAAATAERERQEAAENGGSNTIYYIIGGIAVAGFVGYLIYKHYHKK